MGDVTQVLKGRVGTIEEELGALGKPVLGRERWEDLF